MEGPIPAPELVRDLMTIGVETCTPDTPLSEIARTILEKGIEAVVVIERGCGGNPGDRHAIGMVSQDELVRAYAGPAHPASRNKKAAIENIAAEVMREQIPQIPADIPILVAAQLMIDLKVRALYVMHQAGGVGYPAGVITFKHILRHLAAENPEELGDLGVGARRTPPLEAFFERRDAARKKNQAQHAAPEQE